MTSLSIKVTSPTTGSNQFAIESEQVKSAKSQLIRVRTARAALTGITNQEWDEIGKQVKIGDPLKVQSFSVLKGYLEGVDGLLKEVAKINNIDDPSFVLDVLANTTAKLASIARRNIQEDILSGLQRREEEASSTIRDFNRKWALPTQQDCQALQKFLMTCVGDNDLHTKEGSMEKHFLELEKASPKAAQKLAQMTEAQHPECGVSGRAIICITNKDNVLRDIVDNARLISKLKPGAKPESVESKRRS